MEHLLANVFEKHLGFPGAGQARVASEAFADHLIDRAVGFDTTADELVAWVDHFFEQNHSLEERVAEFAAFGSGEDEERKVLELELGEQEFVALESEDKSEIIVVANNATMVLERTSSLLESFKAAERPPERQSRPGESFRTAGVERAFFVSSGGEVRTLDAKAVLAALRSSTPVRPGSQTPLANATSRLAAFNPVLRSESSSPKSDAVRQVLSLASSEGTSGTGSVKLLERTGAVREVSGASARAWQKLTSHVTQGGRRSEGALAGASAVALGQQTYAVKAGGITAIVQRSTPSLAQSGSSASEARVSSSRAERAIPGWLRALLAGTPRSGFWIEPQASVPGVRPAWVSRVREQARGHRERAQEELAGRLDPAPQRGPLTLASPAAMSLATVRAQVNERGGTSIQAPIGFAGALPATTLQLLLTSLERSAQHEGRHISSLELELATPAAGGGALSRLELESAPMATPELGVVRTTLTPTSAGPEFQNTPRPSSAPSLGQLFSLPFGDEASLRVGPELDMALGQAFARPGEMLPTAVPASLEALVRVSGTPERVRIELPDLRSSRARVVEKRREAVGTGAVALDLASFGSLEWSTMRTSDVSVRRAGRHEGQNSRGMFAGTGWPVEASPEANAPQLGLAPVDMSLAAPATSPAGGSAAFFDALPPGKTGSSARVPWAPALGLGGTVFGFGETSGAVSASTPIYVEPALATSPLPLSEVNARRSPAGMNFEQPVYGFVSDSDQAPETDVYEIPQPLHVQMSSLGQARVFARSRTDGPMRAQASFMPAQSAQSMGGSSFAQGSTREPVQTGLPAASKTVLAAPFSGAGVESTSVAPAMATEASAAKTMPVIRRSVRESPQGTQPDQILVSSPVGETPVHSASGMSSSQYPERSAAARVILSGASGASSSSSMAGRSAAQARVNTAGDSTQQLAGRWGPALSGTPASSDVPGLGKLTTGSSGSPSALFSAHAHEAVSGAWTPGNDSVRTRRRGGAPLSFRYPTSARWWSAGTEGSSGRSAGGYAGASVGSAAYVAAGAGMAAATGAKAEGVHAGAVRPPRASTVVPDGGMSNPLGENSTSVPNGGISFSRPQRAHRVETGSGGSASRASSPGGLGESEMAYVALGSDGNAHVMGPGAASRVASSRRTGAPVDMAVVGAVPPKAPSLEQMAVPGHERPHAKGKKEGSKAGATPKSDAMSLQGTVDSLAQRIYHRLRRRLASDRERFGG